MEELKPCPFCGEPPKINEYHGSAIPEYSVDCMNDNCPAYAGSSLKETKEETIEAWNTRAERTCKVEPFYFAKPKTIEDIQAGLFLRCSECHASIDKHKASVRITERRDGDIEVEVVGTEINYCPNCGAKAVK